MTISRLLDDPKAQAALHGRVLVVDEAGMVSGRQMEGVAAQEAARLQVLKDRPYGSQSDLCGSGDRAVCHASEFGLT